MGAGILKPGRRWRDDRRVKEAVRSLPSSKLWKVISDTVLFLFFAQKRRLKERVHKAARVSGAK